MSLESQIRAALVADSTITSMAAGRVFGGRAAPQTPTPYIVYQTILAVATETQNEISDVKACTVQVAAYGTIYDDVCALSARALAVLLAAFGDDASIEVQDRDGYDDPLKLFRRDFDLTLWTTQSLAV